MIIPRGKSITLRLTLLFASVSALVLLVLGLVIGSLVDRHFGELDSELLSDRMELVRHALEDVKKEDKLEGLSQHLDELLIGDENLSVQIFDGDGELLYATTAVFKHGQVGFTPTKTPVHTRSQDGESLWIVSDFAEFGMNGAPPAFVRLVSDQSHHERFIGTLKTALWSTVVIAAITSGLLGWAAVRSGLSPLRDISIKAAKITANHLDQRLPVESVPIELAEVVRTLNGMLGRLEDSFCRLSDFSSDLAHELRTPVSNLLTQTQVTLSKARDVRDYQEVLISNAEEYERLSRTIGDMLYLAKAENDLIVPAFETVDLRKEATDVLEFYEALAEEKEIRVRVEGDASVSGDRLMLRRAIGNLLSNALRYTPEKGRIDVRINVSGEEMAIFSVGNSGVTIEKEHLNRLFDRFYRADPSRARDSEGVGLGLAITRSILRAHGGDATVRSSDGYTVFEFQLPSGKSTEQGL